MDYLAHRELFKKNPEKYSQDYSVIMRDIDEGRTDFEVWNFSMRSFLFKLQNMSKTSVPEARENIKRVLEGLLVKYPQIGYCQGMNYIIGFILCFANEEETFELFSDLVERILPSRFFQKSEKGTGLLGVLAERHVLKKLLVDAELFKDQQEIEKAQDFLDLKAPQWLLSLLVNILDFEGTHYLFNLLFEWGFFSQVEKTILLIIQRKYIEFRSFGNDSTRITDSITRDINVQVLQNINDIPVDEQMRASSYREYMKEFAEKWNKDDKLTHRQLEKITYFSKEEIQLLQKSFLSLIEDGENQRKHKKMHTCENISLRKEESVDSTNEKSNNNGHNNEQSNNGLNNEQTNNEQNNNHSTNEKNEEKKAKKNRMTLDPERKKKDKLIKGITRSDFSVIMSLLMSRRDEESQLSAEDLDRIFDTFDDDKSGTLDFREFLCCMSLLIKGNTTDKVEMCFSLFDRENMGYLRREDGEKMINALMKSLGLTLKGESEFSKEEMTEFRERMMKKLEGVEKITILDFAGLENDPFIEKIAARKKKEKGEEEQKQE